MAQDRNWIVTTSSDRPIQEIAKELEAAGLSVVNVNDEIQSITGAAAQGAESRMRSIRGVVDISPDEPVDIGPPDSPDTW